MVESLRPSYTGVYPQIGQGTDLACLDSRLGVVDDLVQGVQGLEFRVQGLGLGV